MGQNAGIAIGSTEVFAWVIDYYLLDDRKDMEKKAQEEKDTIKKAWKRAESIRTVSAKSKDSDTKKDVSEEAKVAAKPAAQKKEEPEKVAPDIALLTEIRDLLKQQQSEETKR